MRIGPEHGRPLPVWLSRSADKRRLYAADTYFVESFEDASQVGGKDTRRFLETLAAVTIKPDGLVARACSPTLAWLDAGGFLVAAARRVRLHRHAIRAIWAYQLNAASRDRKNLADKFLSASDSLYLLLRGPPDLPGPAAEAIGCAKGPSDPSARRAGQLRHEIGAAGRLLSYVHAPNDPADLVREIGVLFPAEDRRLLFAEAMAPSEATVRSAEALARTLEADVPAVDLGLDRVLSTVRNAIAAREAAGADRGDLGRLRALLDADRQGGSIRVDVLFRLMDLVDLHVSWWTRLALSSYLIDRDVSGLERLVS
jgi:hypothetical protein